VKPPVEIAPASGKLGILLNGAPNLSADVPALMALALETQSPMAGKGREYYD